MAKLGAVLVYSASPSAAGQGNSFFFKVDSGDPLFCTVHAKQAAGGGSDTLKVKIQGRLDPSLGWQDLKKQDMSTEASSAQVAGAAKEEIFQCQIMPEMRVDISGTITGARAVSCHIFGVSSASRANS